MAEYHDETERRIEQALIEAGNRQAAPPVGFTASVMRRVEVVQSGLSPWRRWRRARQATNFSRHSGVVQSHSHRERLRAAVEGDNVGKKILWGVMGLGAAAVISAFVLDIPPLGDGTAGTIGAAKRYQGAQLSSKDVVVGPMEVQKFIQSDAFDRIMKNESARKFLVKASQDAKMRSALTNPALIEAFQNEEFRSRFLSAEFQQAFSKAGFNVEEFLSSEFHAADLLSVELKQAFQTAEFQRALQTVEFQQALMSVELKQAFLSADFQSALAEPAFQKALSSPAFMSALSEPAFQQALRER